MSENPDKAAAIAAKYIPNGNVDDITRGLKNMVAEKAWGLDGGFTMAGLEPAQTLYQQLGVIPKIEKPEDIATTAYIDRANKELGPAK
jgi:ABC-type nitrate/sulfonate/bicarbonate transport system substrate-binding protein